MTTVHFRGRESVTSEKDGEYYKGDMIKHPDGTLWEAILVIHTELGKNIFCIQLSSVLQEVIEKDIHNWEEAPKEESDAARSIITQP